MKKMSKRIITHLRLFRNLFNFPESEKIIILEKMYTATHQIFMKGALEINFTISKISTHSSKYFKKSMF